MTPLLILAAEAAQAAKDPPIIDLDSTVFLQLAIFVITAILLSRFLFRPYLAVKAARSSGMEGAKDEARHMDEEAAARMADYQQAVAQAKSKANAERGRLQADAVKREHEIVEAARAVTQANADQARAKLDVDAAAARAQLEPRAQEIARAIARKILGREVA